ncbi:hypothetical protein BHM03_00039430 [Ensete ventricosum]|nr:hypothetical protein BHM03_00039430 [Ensete ventricosum]
MAARTAASDEWNDLKVPINLSLGSSELVDDVPPHCQKVQITPVLAANHENVGPPESIFELLEGLPGLRVLLELRDLELLQEITDQLQVPCEPLAVLLVHPRGGRRLHDQPNQPGGNEARQLGHRRELSQLLPSGHYGNDSIGRNPKIWDEMGAIAEDATRRPKENTKSFGLQITTTATECLTKISPFCRILSVQELRRSMFFLKC